MRIGFPPMNWLVLFALAILVVAVALLGWRELDGRSAASAWQALVEAAGPAPEVFDLSVIESLPEPAQRYFRYTIRPGTPLHRAVELEMEGQLGLGTKDKPNYRPMVAHQVLAPPHGLVWKLKSGSISGSDGATRERSWTRFWLFGIVPIVRAGGNEDHRRSAFGRVVAEGAFWAPASLLPGSSVEWKPLDDNSARAIVTFAGLEQAVDISVAEDGRPTRVVIERWSNENAEKTYREQSFGGDLSGFEEFAGYRLPTAVEGGNHIGTDNYFPFFRARVTAIRFPVASDER